MCHDMHVDVRFRANQQQAAMAVGTRRTVLKKSVMRMRRRLVCRWYERRAGIVGIIHALG